MIGRLFGLDPASASESRVLELGCGDGANALSIAHTLPGASVLGLDMAAGAIARGLEQAGAAAIANVELRSADIEALPEDLESFDYIIAHGVYSWISPRARAYLLAAVRRHLAPQGIAYVSYNAYPGSYIRDMAREILRYHVRDIEDPERRLAGAQELMRTIVAIETPSPYAQVLREHVQRMLSYGDALLFHDDLAEISTPFYFHEFIEHAAQHHLGFLAEADMYESQLRDVPQSAVALLEGLPEDAVMREQYLDFFKNRMFRKTLLCHEGAPVCRTLDDTQIERFAISSTARAAVAEVQPTGAGEEPTPAAQGEDSTTQTFLTPEGVSMTTSEPHVQAAMHALAEASPATLEFPQLLACALAASGPEASAELVGARLRTVLLQAYLARIVDLYGCAPPLTANVSERPIASPLARVQCAAGQPAVSSLLHANVRLEDEQDRRLVALLDGTRDRGALLEVLPATTQLDEALERIAALGLLHA